MPRWLRRFQEVRVTPALWELGRRCPKRSQAVPGGSKRYQMVPGSMGAWPEWSQMFLDVQGGSTRYQVVPGAVESQRARSQEVPEGPKRLLVVPRGPGRSESLAGVVPRDPMRYQAVPIGIRWSRALWEIGLRGPKRCQAAPGGTKWSRAFLELRRGRRRFEEVPGGFRCCGSSACVFPRGTEVPGGFKMYQVVPGAVGVRLA